MEKLLVLAFVETDGSLAPAALASVHAARALDQALGSPGFGIGLIGDRVQPALAQLSGSGAGRTVAVTGEAFAQSRYATDAVAAEALARASGATIVVAAGTPRASRILPAVAHRLQGRADTHVTALSANAGQPSVTRWFYRQRIEGTFQREQRPWILLLEPGCSPVSTFEATDDTGPAVELISVEVPASLQRTRVTGRQAPPPDQQTIRPDAELLFVAGAGWTKKQADSQVRVNDAERLILDFLHRSRASLGSSKSLVDVSGEGQAVLSCLTHLNQVGQTGSTPRHPKGLSTCCHGEEPHAVGWRFIRERRAVNLDANCGWARGKADVLYVADAFAVMEKVNALLGQGP
jgi:electron transfer flavoprotein alpha subunit